MNPLLALGGLPAARRNLGSALHRTAFGAASYAILTLSGFIAAGFLTAACFLYISGRWGSVTASLVIAFAYVIAGSIGYDYLIPDRQEQLENF
jgi:hypothetical protein